MEEEFEYVEVDNDKEEIKNKKQLYLGNDYSKNLEYPLQEDIKVNQENMDLKVQKKSKSNMASKRPVQKVRET